jgi:hypothetical protein
MMSCIGSYLVGHTQQVLPLFDLGSSSNRSIMIGVSALVAWLTLSHCSL